MIMTRMKTALLLLAALSLIGCAALKEAGLDDVLTLPADIPLDESTVVAGLKDALRVGTERAVTATSRTDGFLGSDLIRIPLPDQLSPVTDTLRDVGLGSYVDDLEVGMNRAAEKAAAEAAPVFWTAVTSMSVSDAFGILEGHDTAATEYFRGRTGAELAERFAPIVGDAMDEVGLSRLYDKVTDAYTAVPLTSKPPLIDLDAWVVDGTLDGLFTTLGAEERKIREDPAARTTELLRRVFGR